MNVEPRIAESDTFPALDFKFLNKGKSKDLITRIIVDVCSAEVDLSPALDYSLECQNGDLVLVVNNYGWGDADNFHGTIDLKVLDAAVEDPRVELEADAISADLDRPYSDTSIESSREEAGNSFILVNHERLNVDAVPSPLRGKAKWANEGHYTDEYNAFVDGGIKFLPGVFKYVGASGREVTERVSVGRVPRGVSVGQRIYLFGDRFECVRYLAGMACMLPPSYEYHFLLDPDQGSRTYEKSVAHEMDPGEYERVWLVLASIKSAFYNLKCTFVSASGATVESPIMQLHIWNPRNGALQTPFSREVSEIAYPTNYEGKPLKLAGYDVSRLRRGGSYFSGY